MSQNLTHSQISFQTVIGNAAESLTARAPNRKPILFSDHASKQAISRSGIMIYAHAIMRTAHDSP